MKSIEDALALSEKEQDNFYVSTFMIEAWLGEIVLEAAAEYAEKKNAKDRTMQTGQAWRGFLRVFGRANGKEFHHVLQDLYRFAEYDDVQARMLLRAIVPVSVEHECFGDFIGPKTLDIAKQPSKAIRLMRRTVERWCDWLDSLIHFDTHEMFHLSPASFDPDPQKRELAVLGSNQRAFAHLSDFSKSWWQWHHGEAAERFRASPKWAVVGKAMASDETKLWNNPEVDTVVISLWPLVKRHNWTYRDLAAVGRRVLTPPHRYPLEREQDLAAYCANVLGLRKAAGTPGKSSPDGKPKAYEVALQLLRLEPDSGSS